MKKIRVLLALLVLAVVMSTTNAFAAGLQGEEFDLAHENSGFKVIIPNFVELKDMQVDVFGETVEMKNVIVMGTPKPDSNGNYPIFEIKTTNKDAYSVDSYPGTYSDGQLGSFQGQFKDGSIVFSPSFNIGGTLADISKGKVFKLDFNVYDKDGVLVESFVDLNFTFVNGAVSSDAKPAAPTKVKAKVTTSKVLVGGKETAFEAYNISNNNFFKLRDLAMVMNGTGKQFSVGYDSVNKAISLTKGEAYKADGSELAVSKSPKDKDALVSPAKLFIDGKEVQLTAYNIDGSNYFKLRDVAKAIDFAVIWDSKTQMISLDSSAGYTEQ